jgi:hypothetical protein
MNNNNAQLTPLGEWIYSGIVAVLFIGMGYAVVRATAVIVVKLGQVLGII